MKTFIVEASETVFYDIKVEAESAEKAKEIVVSGDVANFPEPTDIANFVIGDAYEENNKII